MASTGPAADGNTPRYRPCHLSVGAVLLLLVFAVATGGSGAVGRSATGVSAHGLLPVSNQAALNAPARPRSVAGYTVHARQRMAERGISETQVEAVIASPDPGIFQDDNDTWLVTDGSLIVIIKNGYIVTGIPGQN